VHPLLFGSAATGAGVPALMTALTTLLPPAGGDPDGPASGSVFKVERGPRGERLAYVRMFAGSVRVRDRVRLGDDRTATVTAIEVVEHGRTRRGDAVRAGQIARLSGLRDVRVGDAVGARTRPPAGAVFAPPTLETALAARDPAQATALRQALAQLAEQDPLIDVRQDDGREELLVSLYGEVQKEVIEHALLADFGIPVEFRETTTICIERPLGAGSAVVRLGEPSNPFLATVGLALAPGPAGSGLAFELAVDLGTIPLYVYKTVGAFAAAMAEYVGDALRHGPSGWAVHDCAVTLTACGYSSPGTGAGDFRKLTPLVVRTALEEAGTVVCEPIQRFHLDAPADALPAVLGLLARCRAVPGAPVPAGRWLSLDGEVPAAEVPRLQRGLHGSTHGQGALEVRFDRYEPR
jgi:ribosomal protection tetracycline resistance protein